jgi:hypothetical protein
MKRVRLMPENKRVLNCLDKKKRMSTPIRIPAAGKKTNSGSPAVAWMKDEHGRYVYFNKTAETR